MTTTVHNLFAYSVQKAERWVHDLMEELDLHDPHRAWSILRGTMHALRDRLTVEEAVQFAAQMPELLRGMYFEGWTLRDKPVKTRHVNEFYDLVRRHIGVQMGAELEHSVRAVFSVVSRHISEGEINHVVRNLPEEIRKMWP